MSHTSMSHTSMPPTPMPPTPIPQARAKKTGLRLLLIEDDAADIILFEQQLHEAQARSGIGAVSLQVARTTGEAQALLETQPIDLILLDEGLPQQSGLAWLERFKAAGSLQSRLPVVMLTQRQEQAFIDRAYQAHISAYLVKSPEPGKLSQMIEALLVFWSRVAQLPPAALPPRQAL